MENKKVKKQKLQKDGKSKRPTSRRKVLLVGLVAVLLVAAAGIWLVLSTGKKAGRDGMDMGMDMSWNGGFDLITASGVTSMGVVSDNFEVEDLETKLYIEDIYVSANTEIEAGTPVLKISEESIAEARKELEAALEEAQLKYRTGAIEYEQNKITARYEYETAVLKGEQAKEAYEETLAETSEKVSQAQTALDEANELIAEYTAACENDSYAGQYPYEQLKALYDENLKLLTEKMEEWGVGWAQVTSGRGGSEYERVLASLYTVLEQNLKDYEEAQINYENAVADASLQLQKLQLKQNGLKADLEEAKQEQEEQKISARLTYETALAKAKQARRDYETALQKAQAAYEELENAKESAQKNLTLFEDNLGDGYFRASQSGSLLMINYRAGNDLQPDSTVLAYSVPEEVMVTVPVDQTDIASLNIGDAASVTIPEYGSFQGSITKIDPVSASGSRTSVTYNVTVLLQGEVSGLSANLTATVVFGMGGGTDD